MSGCEIGRSHFQMNSNSPSPFFGIDLMPRRSTTSVDPQSKTRTVEAGNLPFSRLPSRSPARRSGSLSPAVVPLGADANSADHTDR